MMLLLVNSKIKLYFVLGFILLGIVFAYLSISSFSMDSSGITKQNFVEFSNINHNNITQNSVTLVAKTSVPVICKIEYAEYLQDAEFASDVDVNNYPHLKHSVTLSELRPDTRYNYRFQAEYENTQFYSNIRTFNTFS